jgi:hypothetical protein
LLFFRASNNFEETERIIGNCRPKNNENINLINPSPMLIYLYQPTDPSMNSTGIWLKKNFNTYFKNNRFTSVHVFPVDPDLISFLYSTKSSLYQKIMTQISKFETSFKSGNKILFAFDCHGSPGSMCGHESKHWFTFFKNIKSQTRSDLALITNASCKDNFFYKKN